MVPKMTDSLPKTPYNLWLKYNHTWDSILLILVEDYSQRYLRGLLPLQLFELNIALYRLSSSKMQMIPKLVAKVHSDINQWTLRSRKSKLHEESNASGKRADTIQQGKLEQRWVVKRSWIGFTILFSVCPMQNITTNKF